jgi:ribonuclease H / adenosylcobalamin/alpha-ribazole phosphatase
MAGILWARHGENVANLTRTLSYRVFDGDLTAAGRRQAAELAGRLAGGEVGPVGYLACSPLRRARQTAEIVAARLGLPVAAELDDLREVNVGALDGRSDSRAWDIYHQVLTDWLAGRAGARFPGGEDCAELCARLSRALTAVAVSCAGEGALIVAHGASLRAALPGLTGRPDPGGDLPNGAFATLEVHTAGPGPAIVRLRHWPGAS